MAKVIYFIDGLKISIKKGDITEEKVDTIVNPVNTELKMGAGLAFKIKKKAGEMIEKQVREKAPIKRGEAIISNGYNLPSRYVIHTATMAMDFKTNYKIIEKCVENTLFLAEKFNIKSISFPALGCGTGKLKVEKVAEIMIRKLLEFLGKKFPFEEVNFVLYKKGDFDKFSEKTEQYLTDITRKIYKNPIPTVDIIIEYADGIILIERKNYPFGWALPGGFVDYGESLENAAVREAKEETGLDINNLKQFHTYSEPGRDPRHHTISTVFIAEGKGSLKSGDDAKNVKVFTEKNLPKKIAFDHRKILEDYFKHRKFINKEVNNL